MSNLNKSIVVVIECIKSNAKDNLTFTTPETSNTKTVNLTGKAVEVTNFKLHNEDLSEYVLGGRVTVCIDPEIGYDLIEETWAIFNERAENDDRNPTLAVQFTLGRLDQTSSGYIGKFVTSVEIIDWHECDQPISVEAFKKNAQQIARETRETSEEAINRASLIKKKDRSMANAAQQMVEVPNMEVKAQFRRQPQPVKQQATRAVEAVEVEKEEEVVALPSVEFRTEAPAKKSIEQPVKKSIISRLARLARTDLF